jgi:cytidylate kinase
MERKHSPLRQADDAIRLDTTGMGIEEVVNAIITLAKERL